MYHKFYPDFMEKYASSVIDKARASGATQAQLDAKMLEMGKMNEMYRNPFYRMAWTFIEAFPVGLLFTLVSAALLRRKRDEAVRRAIDGRGRRRPREDGCRDRRGAIR